MSTQNIHEQCLTKMSLIYLGDGELVEQVIGQQTTENGESILDSLIRQLQNEQDERHNAERQAGEEQGGGMHYGLIT